MSIACDKDALIIKHIYIDIIHPKEQIKIHLLAVSTFDKNQVSCIEFLNT